MVQGAWDDTPNSPSCDRLDLGGGGKGMPTLVSIEDAVLFHDTAAPVPFGNPLSSVRCVH